MQDQASDPVVELVQRLVDYLPTLTAGLFVMAVGLVVGWLVKRTLVRILVWLRLDRLGGREAWRAAFGKGDVRAALYNLVGTVVGGLVALVFLDNSLQIWGLTVLSRLIDRIIVSVPNLGLVGVIVGVGLVLANIASQRVEDVLEDEGVPRPRLVAGLLKSALLAVVAALALWQLNFARQIVLAGFLVTFGALGVAFALAIGLGSARAIERGWQALWERRKDG